MTASRRLRAAVGPVSGIVEVPGSKSIANRALAIAALAHGQSALTGLPDGDDTAAMLACLDGLGVAAQHLDGTSSGLLVTGRSGAFDHGATLHAGLAGTTSRFVTALAALATGPVTIDGDPPLRGRPMAELHQALRALGATIDYREAVDHLPLTITGPLRGGQVALRGDVSSQFITALMLIGPLLDGGLTIELTSPLVSAPYVRLTAHVMADFGVDDVTVNARQIVVPAGRYVGRSFDVEPDASSASYPLAVAAVRGGSVTVAGLTAASQQGDAAIADLLGRMGCAVSRDESGTTVSRDPDDALVGLDVDMADVSDLVPTIAVVAAVASTPTTIRGVGFIRAKESDRLGDLATELRKAGAAVDVTDDGLHIEPSPDLHGAALATHHDHRLAMAFAVLGAVVEDISVDAPGVVSKSWPGFWDAYDELLSN